MKLLFPPDLDLPAVCADGIKRRSNYITALEQAQQLNMIFLKVHGYGIMTIEICWRLGWYHSGYWYTIRVLYPTFGRIADPGRHLIYP
jgi:hypothetical protein